MSVMKDLAIHIEEFSCQDGRVNNLLKWIVNQHLAGKYKLDELPTEAQYCMRAWETDQEFLRHADIQAELWEEQHKVDVYNKINFAVNNGVLTHDQGLELINNPEQAERWVRDGVL
jgi:hypothetical protein